jgi:hypothetical protein
MVRDWLRRVKGVYMVPISFLYRSYILSICSAYCFQLWFLRSKAIMVFP